MARMVLLQASPGRPPSRFGTLRQQGRAQAADPSGSEGNGVSSVNMQSSLQTLYGYWNEVRAGRLAPQRLEIEPSSIAGILSETFMLERIDAAAYQFRLAGTRLCELFGSELRGKNFLDGWSDEDRRVARMALVHHLRAGRRRPPDHRGRHRQPPPRRARGHPAAARPWRQDHAHHRRHERNLGPALARQRPTAGPPPQAPPDRLARRTAARDHRSGWASRRRSNRR